MDVHEDILRARDSFSGDRSLRKKIFVLSRDIFEDLSDMVEPKPDKEVSY